MVSEEEIEFIENSNWIEREYSDEAMEDSIKAWNFAKGLSVDIDLGFIKKIHRIIMRRLNPRISGKIRKCPIYVGSSISYRECIKPEKLKVELENWCLVFNKNVSESYKDWKNQHIWFEKIHPFEDGNGRIGRILMNIQRLRMGLPLLIIHEGKEQYDYYQWFSSSHKTSNRKEDKE